MLAASFWNCSWVRSETRKGGCIPILDFPVAWSTVPSEASRPHGLAESVRVQLGYPGRDARLDMETSDRRRAALADGRAPGHRGGDRRQRAEPNVGSRMPGVRAGCIT